MCEDILINLYDMVSRYLGNTGKISAAKVYQTALD